MTEVYNDGLIIYHPKVSPMDTAAFMAVIGRANLSVLGTSRVIFYS